MTRLFAFLRIPPALAAVLLVAACALGPVTFLLIAVAVTGAATVALSALIARTISRTGLWLHCPVRTA